jgi:AraC-like DNA-binding protein
MLRAIFDPDVKLLTVACPRLTRWDIPNMAAPYWRLYRNDRAGAEVRLGGRVVPLRPDRLVLIPPDTPCASRLRRPVRHFFLHFVIRPAHRTPSPAIYSFPAPAAWVSLVAEIDALLLDTAPRDLAISARALALVHAALARVPEAAFREAYADPRVQAAVSALTADLRERVDNDRLAAAAGMNTNAFIRRFRLATGETPQSFRRRRRVEEACLMLHYSAASIEEIASATGFCDRYHFTRAFRRLRGMGPAAFRRARDPGPAGARGRVLASGFRAP